MAAERVGSYDDIASMAAEQVGRSEAMMNYMTKLVSQLSPEEVTEEQCNLLSTAYKEATKERRASWLTVYSFEKEEEEQGNKTHVKVAKELRCKIENEISEICYGFLKLLDDKLLVRTRCFGERKVFYLKMKGDFYRYLGEIKVGDEKKQVDECALNAYKSAQDIAYTELSPLLPTRLGLALNFSIFYYQNLNKYDRACSVAQEAYDEAISEWVEMDEDSNKDDDDDTFMILRHIKDNLKFWEYDMETKKRDALHVVRPTTTAQRRRCAIKEAAKPSDHKQKE